jgi:hypothetical protein
MSGGGRRILDRESLELDIYSFGSREIQNYRVFKGVETADSEVLENLNIRLEQVFLENNPRRFRCYPSLFKMKSLLSQTKDRRLFLVIIV